MERHKKKIRGMASSTPCPWCGKNNDLREADAISLLHKGAVYDCDHCKHPVEVDSAQKVTVLVVKQHHRRR